MLNAPLISPSDFRFTELDVNVCSCLLSDETITYLKAGPTSSGFKLLEPTEPFGIPYLPPGVPLVALSLIILSGLLSSELLLSRA